MQDWAGSPLRISRVGEIAVVAWQPAASAEADPGYLFNPAIIQVEDGYIVAVRSVDPDRGRDILICRVDVDFRPVTPPLSMLRWCASAPPTHLSAHSRQWFADPRLFRLDGQLYISWNDGMPEDRWNSQFLAALNPDTGELGPIRRIRHQDGQFRHEKNWMLFSQGGRWYAVYSIMPHRVLRQVAVSGADLVFAEGWTTPHVNPAYETAFGDLRGGAPPVRVRDVYYSFAHSCFGPAGDRTYVAAAYTFRAAPPFDVIDTSAAPLPLPALADTGDMPLLNPHVKSVVYPCGAVPDSDGWTISYGLDDRAACIARIDFDTVARATTPLRKVAMSDRFMFGGRELARVMARRTMSRLGPARGPAA